MALGPIDYSSSVADPWQGLPQYLAVGQKIRAMFERRDAEKAAAAQQQQYEADVREAMQDPTPKAFAALSLKYPKLHEPIGKAWASLSADQQQNELRDMGELSAALGSGRGDIALARIDERIAAMHNSGQDVSKLAKLREVVQTDPKNAYGFILGKLAAIPGGDKVLENLGKIGQEQRAQDQAPGALRKVNADASAAEADATKTAVDARFAEQAAVLDLQKKGWDIKAIQEDIGFKKEANRIALMNAAAAREGNALKREELGIKIQEARQALDDKIRAKVADTESAASSIDNSLNTIERIKKNKSLDSVLGSFQGRVGAYLSDEASDAIALIDTLGSQAFLSQAANLKGMGALSNAEGEKLQSALTNLSRTQSEEQFRANLDEASRLLKKGRETLSKRSGVPLSAPDTPAAPGSRPPLSSFFKPQGG